MYTANQHKLYDVYLLKACIAKLSMNML